MSKNFELMQQIQSERSFYGTRSTESVFTGLKETSDRLEGWNWANNEALQLVQRIFLLQAQNPPRMVVFAGIDHGDGCTQISASVAQILAQNTEGAVCLVEANFRSPALSAYFGTTNHHGLTDALLGEGPIRSFAKQVSTDDKLWLLSSGALAADSASLLTSDRIRTRLAELRSDFAFVIIDAPPLTRYADAITIGQHVDGLVLILEAGSTRRDAAQTVAVNLRSSNIPILGAVLNKRTFPIPEKIYRRL